MNGQIGQYLAIAKKSFSIMMGDPFMLLMNLSIVAAAMLLAGLPGFTFGDQIRVLRDQSLALAFSGGCLAATLGCAKLVSEEIEGGMIATVMSRPVSPTALIFGTWAGISASLAFMTAVSCVSCLWASRMISIEDHMETLSLALFPFLVLLSLGLPALKNYMLRGTGFAFESNILMPILLGAGIILLGFFGFDGAAPKHFGDLTDWKSAYAYAFIFLGLCSFSAMMILFSTFLNQSNLIICGFLLFFFGLFMKYLVGMMPFQDLGTMLMVFLPDWQGYWIADKIPKMQSFPARLFAGACIHSLIQSAIFAYLASIIFSKKELGAS